MNNDLTEAEVVANATTTWEEPRLFDVPEVERPEEEAVAFATITDTALLLFIRWARSNRPEYVFDPIIARRVLNAYTAIPEGPGT